MTFSKKIDYLLQKHSIKNLRQLAKEINIPYTTLWDYYSNPSRLEKANLSYIKKIAQRLDCTIDYLAYDDVSSPNEIKIDGFDIQEENDSYLNGKNVVSKFVVKTEDEESRKKTMSELTAFMNKNNIEHNLMYTEPNNKTNDNYSQLDQILFSKVKDLSEDDKKAVLGVINAIHKDVDKELDN